MHSFTAAGLLSLPVSGTSLYRCFPGGSPCPTSLFLTWFQLKYIPIRCAKIAKNMEIHIIFPIKFRKLQAVKSNSQVKQTYQLSEPKHTTRLKRFVFCYKIKLTQADYANSRLLRDLPYCVSMTHYVRSPLLFESIP